jgi:thymidylate synthase
MTSVDIEYNRMVNDILDHGTVRKDRTGVGTKALFGYMTRFPVWNDRLAMLTTKHVNFKSILHELLWFLRGDTNIKYLVDNGVNIWNNWPHAEYLKYCANMDEFDSDILIDDPNGNCTRPMNLKEFAYEIAHDNVFAYRFGDIGKVYGKQWVKWESYVSEEDKDGRLLMMREINQLQNAIDLLRNNPDSRRILVTAWYPGQVEGSSLPPCHYAYQFDSVEMSNEERASMFLDWLNQVEKWSGTMDIDSLNQIADVYEYPKRHLSVMFNMRSVDVALGLPFDITSYSILLAMVARATNHVTRDVILSSANTHIYLNHIEKIKEQLTRSGKESLSTITMNLNDGGDIFGMKYDDFELNGYESDPVIKFDIAV